MTPDDIAFLRPDQPVKVQITAYDASRYGSLDGTITRIGADTVLAPDGESSVFVIEIDLSGRLTDIDGQELEITPGNGGPSGYPVGAENRACLFH